MKQPALKDKLHPGLMKRVNPAYLFIAPYGLLFILFIVIPVSLAMLLSLTNYNSISFPQFVGFLNYINLLTQDATFMQDVLPNTILFALVVGPLGYAMSFFLAWSLSQLSRIPRTILALILYSPSMTSGITMAVLWRIIFSGDRMGYINNLLLKWGVIVEPLQFLQSPYFLMPIMIVVAIWSSMGVGFLAMLAGMVNVDISVYEAAEIDGLRNRFQEIFYITIPMMRPQMLFGAVMSVVNTFQVGAIGVQLSGSNPTPNNAGQLIVNHIEDYGFIRYEMGYASAVSVVLLLIIYFASKFAQKTFGDAT